MINIFFGHRTKVLVVNGSRSETAAAQDCLPAAEFEVIRARTSRGGLQAARREAPEIILLDSELPANKGWETLSELKKDGRTAGIPVLMFTPAGDAELPEKVYSLGAQGCIPKPFKKDVVVTRIARRLNRGEQASRKSYF